MPDYPRSLELLPAGEWPGPLTQNRQRASFRSPAYRDDDTGKWIPAAPTKIGKTMRELETELNQIGGSHPKLHVAVNRDDITLDGSRLKAGRLPWHPGVILSFDSPRGEQRYPSDQYTRWEDNLRAIVLTMNSLRALDRWGVTHGQQYSGFLEIESSIAVRGTPFNDVYSAVSWLRAITSTPATDKPDVGMLLREAKRQTHPDLGGDADSFRFVTQAETLLRKAGEL